jgi:DNA-binding LacI/PurR family transcriptional regulator
VTTTREDAVRRALELAPISGLALAREAGVSARLLNMIRDGDRSATPRTTKAVLEAVERLGGRHEAAARVLRDALEATEGDDA